LTTIRRGFLIQYLQKQEQTSNKSETASFKNPCPTKRIMVEKAEWAKLKPSEVENLIVENGKKGLSPERIGLVLRDSHGIPKTKLYGLKIGQVLAKHKITTETLEGRLNKKIAKLEKHSVKHKHDYTSKRKAVMYAARVRKMQKKVAK
jgi:ribosomal protein S15P/S13E